MIGLLRRAWAFVSGVGVRLTGARPVGVGSNGRRLMDAPLPGGKPSVLQLMLARLAGAPPPGSTPTAVTLHRVADLLRGGAPAARVWRAAAEHNGDSTAKHDDLGSEIAARIDDGLPVADAIAAGGTAEWRMVAAIWAIAEQSGAPLASVLDRLTEALLALQRLSQRRSVLLAGPKATIALVASLPIVALCMGGLLGFDPTAMLLTQFGAILAVLGTTLLAIGVWWAAKLTQRVASAEWVAGFEFELCWVAVSGGAAHHAAMRTVADTVDRFQVEWVRMSSLRRDRAVWQVLRAATEMGTPLGPALLLEADAARRQAVAELEMRAERLGVQVLVPLAVCVLPAFVILGVMPVLLAVMGTLDFGAPGAGA